MSLSLSLFLVRVSSLSLSLSLPPSPFFLTEPMFISLLPRRTASKHRVNRSKYTQRDTDARLGRTVHTCTRFCSLWDLLLFLFPTPSLAIFLHSLSATAACVYTRRDNYHLFGTQTRNSGLAASVNHTFRFAFLLQSIRANNPLACSATISYT